MKCFGFLSVFIQIQGEASLYITDGNTDPEVLVAPIVVSGKITHKLDAGIDTYFFCEHRSVLHHGHCFVRSVPF